MTDKNKALVGCYIEEFKNKANHAIVDELMANDFTHHFTDPRLPPGRDTLKVLGMLVSTGFPDVQVTVEDLLSDDDKVIERTTARGTHKGEFNGVPATGKSVTWTEIHIYQVKNGKISELWSEIDMLSLLMQIGAAPGM
jgi:steroid delta-isomerase-like uncharacterized protein